MKRTYCLSVFKRDLNFIHFRVSPIFVVGWFPPPFCIREASGWFQAQKTTDIDRYFWLFSFLFTSNGNTPRLTPLLCSGTSGTSPVSASHNWVHISSTVYLYTRVSSWNPNCNTPEPDRPQHDHPAALLSPNNILPSP